MNGLIKFLATVILFPFIIIGSFVLGSIIIWELGFIFIMILFIIYIFQGINNGK